MPSRVSRRQQQQLERAVAKECLKCFCIMVLILVTLITLFALSFVTRNPKLYVHEIYVPALNNSTESNATRLNTFIFVDLHLRNAMPLNGLRYGDLNVTVFYGSNRTLPVASYAIPGFYQGFAKTAAKPTVVRTRGLPWPDAFQKLSAGSPVDFTLELATSVKLKRWVYLKRKPLRLAADLRFDASGRNKDVRLKRTNQVFA